MEEHVGRITGPRLVSSAEEFDRLFGSRWVIEAITPRVDPLADFRFVLDERFTVDGVAGQLSDASALRLPIEPVDVPAATLLLVLLALAVTTAGLADAVVQNLLVFRPSWCWRCRLALWATSRCDCAGLGAGLHGCAAPRQGPL